MENTSTCCRSSAFGRSVPADNENRQPANAALGGCWPKRPARPRLRGMPTKRSVSKEASKNRTNSVCEHNCESTHTDTC